MSSLATEQTGKRHRRSLHPHSETMDNVTAQTTLANGFVTRGAAETTKDAKRSPCHFWRPWTTATSYKRQRTSSKPYVSGRSLADKNCKPDGISHPVKLFWPRSRCYDYLYQDAEALLRNYPVQATISLCEDSCSDDEESDQECEKVLN